MNKLIELIIKNLQNGFLTVEQNTFMCYDDEPLTNNECSLCDFDEICIVRCTSEPPTKLFNKIKELHPEYFI